MNPLQNWDLHNSGIISASKRSCKNKSLKYKKRYKQVFCQLNLSIFVALNIITFNIPWPCVFSKKYLYLEYITICNKFYLSSSASKRYRLYI